MFGGDLGGGFWRGTGRVTISNDPDGPKWMAWSVSRCRDRGLGETGGWVGAIQIVGGPRKDDPRVEGQERESVCSGGECCGLFCFTFTLKLLVDIPRIFIS